MSATNKMLIILIIVQLVSCRPLITGEDQTNSGTNSETNSETKSTDFGPTTAPALATSSPMPLLITCRAGEFIRRDCKYYIDCYKGRWRRNFCPETKVWNHELKRCDIIDNVPECLAIYLDMKHSPIRPDATNQLTDEEKLKVDKHLDSKKSKPKHKISAAEDEMVVEEIGIVDKKPTENEHGIKSKDKQAIDKSMVKPKKDKPANNPDSTEDNLPLCTSIKTIAIPVEPVIKLIRTLFHYLSLMIILIKS